MILFSCDFFFFLWIVLSMRERDRKTPARCQMWIVILFYLVTFPRNCNTNSRVICLHFTDSFYIQGAPSQLNETSGSYRNLNLEQKNSLEHKSVKKL